MTQKNNLTIEQMQSLCDQIESHYVSKKGKAYTDALSEIYGSKNKNDNPFSREDIKNQPEFTEFDFIGVRDFKFICELKAEPMQLIDGKRVNEKIQAFNFAGETEKEIFNKSLGVAYLLTANLDGKEYFIKIGQSRTTFKSRLGSYNCGVVNNWRTASTTNIKILQSMVSTRCIFNLYLYDCSDSVQTFEWHGVKSIPFASAKSLAVEDILVKEYKKKFNKKPLANVQSNATEVD